MTAAQELAPAVGISAACRAMLLPRSTYYRKRPGSVADLAEVEGDPGLEGDQETPARRSPRALTEEEEQAVLAVLHCERFMDQAPAQVVATLLDEGTYLCSERTMYRILEKHGEVKERRDQCRHPSDKKPELLATDPNQV